MYMQGRRRGAHAEARAEEACRVKPRRGLRHHVSKH